MDRAGTSRTTVLTVMKLTLRFGLPLVGLLVFGQAVLRSVGGDIAHGQFALGILLVLAGFTSKLVPTP